MPKPSGNERAVDGREQVAGFGAAALLAPQPGEARGGAQFVAPRALLAGDRQGGAERVLGLRWIRMWQLRHKFAAQAVKLCIPALLAGGDGRGQTILDGGEALVDLSCKYQRLGQQPEM